MPDVYVSIAGAGSYLVSDVRWSDGSRGGANGPRIGGCNVHVLGVATAWLGVAILGASKGQIGVLGAGAGLAGLEPVDRLRRHFGW